MRDLTAGLLAVLLVCGAALAGVCPLRCGLGVASAMCGHASGRMAMHSPDCDGMGASREHGMALRGAVTVCDHAEASVTVAGERGFDPLGVVDFAVVVAVLPGGVVMPVRRDVEAPPRGASGFDPVLVSFRV